MTRQAGYYWVRDLKQPEQAPGIAEWVVSPGSPHWSEGGAWWVICGEHPSEGNYELEVVSGPLVPPSPTVSLPYRQRFEDADGKPVARCICCGGLDPLQEPEGSFRCRQLTLGNVTLAHVCPDCEPVLAATLQLLLPGTALTEAFVREKAWVQRLLAACDEQDREEARGCTDVVRAAIARHPAFEAPPPPVVVDEAAERELGNWWAPMWDEAGLVHDWRNYVSEPLRQCWSTFTKDQQHRIALGAQQIADREHWD